MSTFTGLASRLRTVYWAYPVCLEAADEIERLQAALGKATGELMRLRGEREPPHCPTCDCHSKSRAKRLEALREVAQFDHENLQTVPSPRPQHE